MSSRALGPVWLGMTAPSHSDAAAPLMIDRGEGVYVYDEAGKRYLDSQGGLWCVNVGHGRQEIKAAINAQLDKIACYNSFVDTSNRPSIKLGQKVVELAAEEDMCRVMFSSGGSDANETALKLARQYWKLVGEPARTRFISMEYGYHGVHFGGASINGNDYYKEPYGPMLPGCTQVPSPFVYRNTLSHDPAELAELCAQKLEDEILRVGPESVAAFIGEPVQGAGGGVIVPPAAYWPRVREICDNYEILLIADEVITGFGRSGNMFGMRGAGIRPDIICLAKGISSGYVPLGATVVNSRVAAAWQGDGPESLIMHGYTYMGHPVACAAGLAALDIVERENLPDNAATVGRYFLDQLRPFGDQYLEIGDIRGKGLMIAVEFVADRESREPLAPDHPLVPSISRAALDDGLIVRGIANKLIMSPPLTFSQANVDEALDILGRALAAHCTPL